MAGAQPGSNEPGKHDGGAGNAVIGGRGDAGIDGGELALGRWHTGSAEPGAHPGLGGNGNGGCAGANWTAPMWRGLEAAALDATPPSTAASNVAKAASQSKRRCDGRTELTGATMRREARADIVYTPPTMVLRISTTSGARAARPNPIPAALNAPLAFSISPGSLDAIR